MDTMKKFLIPLLGVFALLFAYSPAFAADFSVSDDFEGATANNPGGGTSQVFDNHTDNGGTGWTDINWNTATLGWTSDAHTGSLAAQFYDSSDAYRVMATPADSGSINFWVKAVNLPTGTQGYFPMLLYDNSSIKWCFGWGAETASYGNQMALTNCSGTNAVAGITPTADTWYHIEIEIDQPIYQKLLLLGQIQIVLAYETKLLMYPDPMVVFDRELLAYPS